MFRQTGIHQHIPTALEQEWLKSAVADYELDLSCDLEYDEENHCFSSVLDRQTVRVLALMMYVSYLQRELSRVMALNGIYTKDVQITGADGTKRVTKQELEFEIGRVKERLHTGLYDAVVDLDTAMTELKKVTDETDESYDRFLSDAAQKAVDIGTSYSDYVTATANFARLGYSMADASDLAEVATIYSVVGDEISDVNEATLSVTSNKTSVATASRSGTTVTVSHVNQTNGEAMATYTKQESNAATVYAGRIAHKDLKCTCFLVRRGGENYCWIKRGSHVHMFILLSPSAAKQDQLTHLVFKTGRYIRFTQRKSYYLYICQI